ncbi:MAG: hypothetical protein OXG35_21405 [Acidobacteria bacterium]|nr:hypothetical protein [Acidobacteriota bacterium]
MSDPEGRRKRKRRESLKRLVSSRTHVALTTPTAFLDDEPEARQRTTARARKTIARLLDRPDRADDAVETAVREAFPELWTSLERAARGGRHGPGSRAVARWIARTILNVPEHELDAMNRRRREHRQPS